MVRRKYPGNNIVKKIYTTIGLLLLTACSSLPEPTTVEQELARLNQAEQRWQSQQVSDYQYRSKSFGRSDNPYNPFPKVFSKSQAEPDLESLPGVIIQIKNNSYHYSYYENDQDYEAHHFGGFNKLFNSIREMLEQMRSEPDLYIEVDFHPVYGYPAHMVSRQYEGDRLVSISFSYNDQFQVLNE